MAGSAAAFAGAMPVVRRDLRWFEVPAPGPTPVLVADGGDATSVMIGPGDPAGAAGRLRSVWQGLGDDRRRFIDHRRSLMAAERRPDRR